MNLITKYFRGLYNWSKRRKYYLLGFFSVLFLIWLFCLPTQLFSTPTSTVLLDKDGNMLGARIANDGQWRFPPRDAVPYKYEKAILQFEDRDFYSHMGFSLKAFSRAMKQNISEGRVVSGGSTIPMQTIRLSRQGKSRSVWEKVIEVFQATRMEWRYSKGEILAMYSSYAPMGGNVVGLDAASWRYFGRSPENLSWAEASTLAVLPNAPSLMHPGKNREKLIAKRNRLLDRLHLVGEIDKTELQLAKSEPLPTAPPSLPNVSPHVIDRVMSSKYKGKIVNSTLKSSLQNEVNNIVYRHHKHLKKNEIYNLSVLIVEVETGNIIAYVGNAKGEEPEHGYQVDIIKARRSTGSILKPFLYAGALDDGVITPNQLIQDVPTIISGYAPKNYNEKYDGAVPASRALSRSLNVPIVKLLQEFGVQKFHNQLNRLGMTTIDRPSTDYGLSLVLGGAEASLIDLTSIYANMAKTLNDFSIGRKSRFIKPTFVKSFINDRVNDNLLLSPGATWMTFEAMLAVSRPDAEANWQQFSSSQKIAWKTGTSFGFRDAWAIGVTPKYAVGVWVGNADGEGRPGIVGVKAAAPILFDVFKILPKSVWFNQPFDEMKKVPICKQSGFRASDICEVTDSVWIPLSCLNTVACPYHKIVHLDNSGKRVNSYCEEVSNMIATSWFVLPSIIEKFYRNNNPNYKPLPAFREGCATTEEVLPIGIIYPKSKSKIYVPVKLDGTLSKTVFEASHRDNTIKIYWHLDDQYLGETTRIHQMELVPEEGKHVLTLMDELGNEKSRTFEVIVKSE